MEIHDDYYDCGDSAADEIARLRYEAKQIDDQQFAETAQAAVGAAKERSGDNDVVANIPDFIMVKRKRQG